MCLGDATVRTDDDNENRIHPKEGLSKCISSDQIHEFQATQIKLKSMQIVRSDPSQWLILVPVTASL